MLGAASVHAADENYITSAEDAKGSKWSVVVGGGGAAGLTKASACRE